MKKLEITFDRRKVILPYDNARPHIGRNSEEKFERLKDEVREWVDEWIASKPTSCW